MTLQAKDKAIMSFNFNMSDPLTLGLNLGDGHSVKQRIRRITMRHEYKWSRAKRIKQGGAALAVLMGLGLTTPITSNVIAGEAPEIIAELRLLPDNMDADIEAELNKRRNDMAEGRMTPKELGEWSGLRSQMVTMKLTESGPLDVTIYDVQGYEISGPAKQTALASLMPIYDKCAAHAKTGGTTPDLYNMAAGSTGRVYSASCKPIPKEKVAELTADEKIAIIMADEDIDYERRQARALGVKIRQLHDEFTKTTPYPTRVQFYDHCIYKSNILNEDYRIDSVPKKSKENIEAYCQTRTEQKYGPLSE